MAGDWEALILENLIKSWTAQKLNGGLDNTKFDVRVLMMIFYFFWKSVTAKSYFKSAWANYFWSTSHFSKLWQLAGHFQQNDG